MKKIIFLFLILFVSILTVKAQNNFYIMIEEGDSKIKYSTDILYLDNNVVYSLNPYKNLNLESSYNSYTYNDSVFNLTDEMLDKINVISHYGYNNHNDIEWYAITQFLIFKNLGFNNIYFSDIDGNPITEYNDEISELESLVEKHYLLPEFANNTYTVGPYQEYSFRDQNNVISTFEISENDFDMNIESGKLKFKTKEQGVYDIMFSKQNTVNKDFVLYSNEEGNLLISAGKTNDITFSLTLRVIGGSITINRYESTPGERLEATLVGSEIGVYKNNGLFAALPVDENGTAKIDNLPLGIYTVKERDVPKGYVENPYTYTVYITEDSREHVISWGSNVIEGNIIINKYYGEEGNYKLDEEAVFEIYHRDKLIKTLKSKNGIIKEKLEYGIYTIKQISGIKYYDLCEEFTVKIDKVKDYKYDLYTQMDKDLNEFLDEKNEELNSKNEVLSRKEKELEEEKDYLLNLKNELLQKQDEINNEKNLINTEKDILESLKKELNNEQKQIEDKKNELLKLEEELNKLKNILELTNDKLIFKEDNLKKLELEIKSKEELLNKNKEELDVLKTMLLKKEEELAIKENSIKEREIVLNEKENNIIKLQNKIEKENVLVVEVPNTYRKNYNRLISIVLIIIGSIIIVLKKRKVTNH